VSVCLNCVVFTVYLTSECPDNFRLKAQEAKDAAKEKKRVEKQKKDDANALAFQNQSPLVVSKRRGGGGGSAANHGGESGGSAHKRKQDEVGLIL
jgi:hypothetical protein